MPNFGIWVAKPAVLLLVINLPYAILNAKFWHLAAIGCCINFFHLANTTLLFSNYFNIKTLLLQVPKLKINGKKKSRYSIWSGSIDIDICLRDGLRLITIFNTRFSMETTSDHRWLREFIWFTSICNIVFKFKFVFLYQIEFSWKLTLKSYSNWLCRCATLQISNWSSYTFDTMAFTRHA